MHQLKDTLIIQLNWGVIIAVDDILSKKTKRQPAKILLSQLAYVVHVSSNLSTFDRFDGVVWLLLISQLPDEI
jgi:hypothetical protein